MPFATQAHHIIQNEVFSEGEERITPEELKLLAKIPYCLNHGENIIFLPDKLKNCEVFNLPLHNGSHPDYNNKSMKEIDGIKDQIKVSQNEACDVVEMPKGVLQDLIDTQELLWKWTVKQGPGSINNHASPENDIDSIEGSY